MEMKILVPVSRSSSRFIVTQQPIQVLLPLCIIKFTRNQMHMFKRFPKQNERATLE